MVYGELGSYPVSLTIKIRLISFWLKLISTPDDRISKQMYNLIYRMHQNNTHQSAWLNCIRQILEQNGFGYVWLDQGLNIDHMYVKDTLYSCLQDQFVQEWTGTVDAGRKCTLYKHIKTDFKLEPYLLRLSCDTYRYIVKLRCSNHKLAIETGRYSGIDRNLRYCDLCALDILGDEYHTFFECTKPEIVSLRKRFIPLHYSQQPSMFKFVKLLRSADDIKVGNRISSFIRHSKIV